MKSIEITIKYNEQRLSRLAEIARKPYRDVLPAEKAEYEKILAAVGYSVLATYLKLEGQND